MSDCIFCKIFKGEIPSNRVYEDEKVIGFKDLHPQAKTHLLFIHKNHTSNFNDMAKTDPQGMSELMTAVARYTDDSGLSQAGYRIVTNIGPSAGQSVFHTHMHILSSSKLGMFGE